MNNIINLTKIFLITSFNRNGNRKNKKTGRVLLYAFLFIYLIGIFSYLSYELIISLKAINQETSFVGLILMTIISLIMLSTVVSVINVLYFSDDNRFILPLPVKPYEVLFAKMNTLLIYVYFEELIIGLVPLLMYGYLTNQSIIYYFLLLLVLLVLPLIPLLIASMLVIVIMALLKGIKNKSLVQLVTTTIAIILSLSISMFSSSMSSNEDVMILIAKAGAVLEIYKKAFFTMPLAINTLIDYNLLSLLLLIVVSVFCYIIVCLSTHKLYYRGMLGSLYSSSGISNRKINEKDAYKSRGLLFTYVMKELRVYLRKPTFFVQLILPTLILAPFMIGIMYFSVASQSADEINMVMELFFMNKEFEGYIISGLIIASMFFTMYCTMPSIAISKDGHDAYIMKYIPVAFYKQVIYKMIPDILLCILPYLISGTLLVILFKTPLKFVLLCLPVVIVYSIAHSFIILTDLRKPKIEWTSEIYIVKNNFRTLFTLVFGAINISLVVMLTFVLKVDKWILIVGLLILYCVIDYLLFRYIRKKDIRLADGFE